MSCFNCYSARKIDAHLIDKILVQGQQLRSAMVQSILNNDPLTPRNIVCPQEPGKFAHLPQDIDDKIRAFLRGDAMTKEDEIHTLETLRSMSPADLCRATERTYRSSPCECSTCVEYNGDFRCDLKRDNEVAQMLQTKYRSEARKYLKFVDSFKVSVKSVVLNQAGHKKVAGAPGGQTFFLEYQIPEVLSKNHQKQKAKVDSGLGGDGTVRICARGSHLQAIPFRQVSIHDCDLTSTKLSDTTITFRLSCRSLKQKQPLSLGVAKFSFASFEVGKNFVCNQELTLRLNEINPIVVGGLKVSVQLGCGRLYFGKEFLDAVTNDTENAMVLGSDDLSDSDSDLTERIPEYYPKTENSDKNVVPKLKLTRKEFKPMETKKPKPQISGKPKPVDAPPAQENRESERFKPTETKKTKPQINGEPKPPPQANRPVLFGYICIFEAQFSREVMNSYLRCQMFGSDDTCSSKLVAFESNPIYNFSQQFPVICDDDVLLRLRENFMVVEFFEKGQKDFLVGLSEVPLHQFYLAYRNPVVVKYLSERKLPVIATDGWEPVVSPSDGEVVGQARILVALGTKEQIDALERENQSVKAKKIVSSVATVDVGIQSNMEPKKDMETFLNQLVQKNNIEQSEETRSEVRSTSDLLDSLQKALFVDTGDQETSFKAQVVINSALHLPSRRKCKSKRSKGKSGKHEEILPSTYVTFEDYTGGIKVTPIVSKSTAPKWEFRCDVALPVQYLTDTQKFLVFKVWRKSTNTTLTPNMQVDHVIGFATVDLTVLAAGLPSVQGWFNINDLSKKCNGQINIHVTPLENVQRHQQQQCCPPVESPPPEAAPFEPGELLGRALKRKFTELDEITQRLRLRLSKVTNDESDTSNDEVAEEFERDINTLCVEDDFDTVDFEKEAHGFSLSRDSEVGLLQTDQHLVDSKQKIDQMLEKLSLISGEMSSRYVSGCSEGRIDTEAMLNELDTGSRPNLFSAASFSRDMEEKFGCRISEESSGESSTARCSD